MKRAIFFFIWAFCFTLPLFGSKAKPFKSQQESNNYFFQHNKWACHYYNTQQWKNAATEFEKIIYFFPESDTAAESAYYLAICYYEMREYDFSNEEFSNYLKASQHPTFFEDAVRFKFCIAEHFKAGKKKRPFKMRYLPKWVSGQEAALTIYDEVVAALPNHELTICALWSKGELLKQLGEYRLAVDTYQLLIRRFPKNEIVPDCYLQIADSYFQLSKYEFQNPDLLALAELNVKKFKEEFPREERIAIAENSVCRIKEMYAKGLCDLGRFYERMKHPDAAAIYYQSSIEEFPDTRIAEFCRSRLVSLGYPLPEEERPADSAGKEEMQPALQNAYSALEENPSLEYYHYSTRKNSTKREPYLNEIIYDDDAPQPPSEEKTSIPPQEQVRNNSFSTYLHYSEVKSSRREPQVFQETYPQ